MFKFNSLKSAQSFADKAIKPQAIILGDYRDWETDRKSTRLNSSH